MNEHIEIGDTAPRIQYVADGTQAEFAYPFPIFAVADLVVFLDDTEADPGLYDVTGAGLDEGGAVTFAEPPADGTRVTLLRHLAIRRTSDFQEGGAFRARTLNDELDYLTAALQQVSVAVDRALRLSATDPAVAVAMPSAGERAGRWLAFDLEGLPIASAGTAGSSDLPVSAFAETLLDDADAAAARATLGAAPLVAITTGDLTVAGEAGPEALGVGAEGELLGVADGRPAWVPAPEPPAPADLVVVEHREASGVAGGTFDAGAWRVRPLTAVTSDTGGHAGLDSSEFTLAAGTWDVDAWSSAGVVAEHQARLWDVDGDAVAVGNGGEDLYGTTTFANSSGEYARTASTITGRLVLAVPTTFRIEHRGSATRTGDGFGRPAGFGGPEVYARVVARRLA